MPWGSPARAQLATPYRPASCHVASWSCSPPTLSSLPSGGGARFADRIYAPSGWFALYDPLPQRFSARIARASRRGLPMKGLKCYEQFSTAMTGLVIGTRHIFSLGDVERMRIVIFLFPLPCGRGPARACESAGLFMLRTPNTPYLFCLLLPSALSNSRDPSCSSLVRRPRRRLKRHVTGTRKHARGGPRGWSSRLLCRGQA